MIDKRYNIFETATELVSLDCSSITGQAFSVVHQTSSIVHETSSLVHDTSSIVHNTSHSLKQSLLNLKSVLPTFTTEFNIFKEEIIEITYLIANKLVSQIKTKNQTISQLQIDLEKSKLTNVAMKQEVIQLQLMIAQFVDSHKKSLMQKDKEINQKKKEIDELKTVLKLNFNSPRHLCQNCKQDINFNEQQHHDDENSAKQFEDLDLKLKNFFNSQIKNSEIFIQNHDTNDENDSEPAPINTKKSLEIIQEEGSEVNSLTDYLHSQRCSQKQNTSQSVGELIRSARSDENNEKQEFYTGKRSALNFRNTKCENPQNIRYLCDQDHQSSVGKINYFQNLQNKPQNSEVFSSRPNHENIQDNFKVDNKKERRNSEIISTDKITNDGFKIERKTQERPALAIKTPQNQNILSSNQQFKQQMSLKAQLEQISKSSSCSDLNHFGDNQVNVNLPKKFQSPKNMNFLKQYHTHTQKDDRLRTEPSPKNQKYEINKENIHIEYQPKPNQMGRKIIARKKMIMTHAKASTSRIEAKRPLKEQCAEFINQPKYEDFSKKKTNFIEIKLIDSPQKDSSKSTYLLKPSVQSVFTSNQVETVPRRNACMEYSSVNSNISTINESAVKNHHMYHSSDKYQSAQTPKNIHKITMTPGKLPGKSGDRKSMSKSKEKLKVMSKSINQDQTILNSQEKKSKQRFLAEMNSSFFSSVNTQSVSKIKNKNLSIQIGSNGPNNQQLKQSLNEIKTALINFDIKKITNTLREVYYDGKVVNGMKEGFGKVVYDNGIIYEGLLRNGKKDGEGKYTLNGVVVFEGNFSNDMIEGQGNLRFFKYFVHASFSCPKILQNASYFGSFSGSHFNGMGTVFLNEKEKIVTKFVKGEPSGELTFYTQSNIEFGHWPLE